MRKVIYLSWILIYDIVLRFWRLGQMPPLIDQSIYLSRYINAFISIGSLFLLYFYSKKIFKKNKPALISAFVFVITPWVFEQGRIYSQVNIALFIFLAFILSIQKVKSIYINIFLFSIFYFLFSISYPQFWLFKTSNYNLPINNILNNIFIIISPEFFFLKNPTFWWGGVREFGILYLSFLPFLLIGIYRIVIYRKWKILFGISIITLISAMSPFFPESREFFLATPFITLIVANGVYEFYLYRSKLVKMLFFIVFLFLIYEAAQFMHYYTVHYPQQISSNLGQIKEPF